ncbi:unnamed protein product [Paramecium pentaurelia]|uniref:RING-type domain-containing protein n=1 Tax=Paramecium pentaurelia TaxID=43138 RepID=A0A8S1VNT9_9CILI|nr:unnamed protein product [Paramecium pentaurelia]
MINTITFGLLLLNFFKVLTIEFEISISQGSLYSQKRIVNTISANTTFIVNCYQQFAQYCTIELNQTSNKPAEIALLYLEGQAPFLDNNNDFIYDGMDYDSYVQKKRNHFIQIPSSKGKMYFTVLTNIPVSFDIYLRGSQTMLCQNNCKGNGICIEGECKCDSGFISRDCSLRALQLEQEKTISVNGSHDPNFYCYYEYKGSQDLQLEISIKDENEAQVYLLIPDLVYLPTVDFYNDAARITKKTPFKRQIEQRKSKIKNDQDKYIPDKLIILLQGVQFKIRLEQINGVNKEEQMKLIIIVVCSIAGSILLCFCIFLIRRIRQKRSMEKLTPEDYEMREKQFTYGGCLNKKEDDQFGTIDNQLQSNNLQDNCAICLDPLSNKQPILQTICKHIYHVKCIEKWLEKNQFCPFCRFDLKIENLKQQRQQIIKVPITNQVRIVRRNN